MRVMVDMSATLLHKGHVRLLKEAKKIGDVVVGLTNDDEIFLRKGYHPEIPFSDRKEILEALNTVDEVVETPWLITDKVLKQFNIDVLLHGEDNQNQVNPRYLKVVPRTQGVSSHEIRLRAQESLVSIANCKKLLTPGPGRLLSANLRGLVPCYGDGDDAYNELEKRVLDKLKHMSGHTHIAPMQGADSMALEVAFLNFIQGRCLIIDSGYQSKRPISFANESLSNGKISQLEIIKLEELDDVSGSFDWIAGVYTEKSVALKNDISVFKKICETVGAKLFIDATGSMGLEDRHELADVICYSSCGGLLGLTGASFVAFNEQPQNEISSFTLSLDTYFKKKCAGPYHSIASLDHVLESHGNVRLSIEEAKRKFMADYKGIICRPHQQQPNLCTMVYGEIVAKDDPVILFQPYDRVQGTSILCHLGEASISGIPCNDVLDKIQFK